MSAPLWNVFSEKTTQSQGKTPSPQSVAFTKLATIFGRNSNLKFIADPRITDATMKKSLEYFIKNANDVASKIKKLYKVIFNSMGGSSLCPDFVEQGTNISKPEDPTKQGYKFKHWYENTASSVDIFASSIKATQDTTYYAAWEVDTTAPSLTSLRITSTPSKRKIYVENDPIEVSATFSEDVNVTGRPYVELVIGSATKQAYYDQGSSTKTTLVFAYTVQSGDDDSDGISIAADALNVPKGAAITDVVGNAATLTHRAIGDDANHAVDAVSIFFNAAITSRPKNKKSYVTGEVISVRAAFPSLKPASGLNSFMELQIGNNIRKATCPSGMLKNFNVTCKYKIQSSDKDTDGISIKAYALRTSNGAKLSSVANAEVPDDPQHKVNAP